MVVVASSGCGRLGRVYRTVLGVMVTTGCGTPGRCCGCSDEL